MAKGLTNCEVARKFKISEDALADWIKRWPEFAEAWKEGKTARKAYLAESARTCWLEGKDKGYKYFAALAGEELGFQKQLVSNNQINIGNVNLLDSKSREDLLEFVTDKLKMLPIDVSSEMIPVDIKSIEDKTGEDK